VDLSWILLGFVAFGALTGVLSGVLGVGGGIFIVPMLVLVAGMSQHEAQATSLLVVLPTAIVASWSLHRKGVGDLRLGLRMGAIGVVGGIAGTLLALALPGGTLRVLFAGLMTVVGVRLIADGVRAHEAVAH
jgi:uncharacterized membrane protein YfcA